MRNRKFDQMFKEEFNKANANPLTLDDIFEKGTLKRKTCNYKFWKYTSINLACLLVVCLVAISVLLVDNINTKKNQNLNNDSFEKHTFQDITFTEENNILTASEKEYAKSICDVEFDMLISKYLKINNDITMYVYSGDRREYVDDNLIYINVYFYVFDFQNHNQNIIMNIDENEIVVNKDNRFGILDNIKESEKQEIAFTLTYYENSQKIVYKN